MTRPAFIPRIVGEDESLAIAASGTVAGGPSDPSPKEVSAVPALIDYRGWPSPEFVARGRNVELAANPPSRFEPIVKAADDVVI